MKKIFKNRKDKSNPNDMIYKELDALTIDLLRTVQDLTNQLQAEQMYVEQSARHV